MFGPGPFLLEGQRAPRAAEGHACPVLAHVLLQLAPSAEADPAHVAGEEARGLTRLPVTQAMLCMLLHAAPLYQDAATLTAGTYALYVAGHVVVSPLALGQSHTTQLTGWA